MIRVHGHAALFDRVDRASDVFRRGAFADAQPVPLLHAHRGEAVGTIEAIGEDEHGLRIAATVRDPLLVPLVRAGALAGLSVGYRPLVVHQGARREIARVALAEISLVAVPMQPGARVDRIETFSPEEHQA